MIISIRGSNGSGKSFVVREVLARGHAQPIYGMLGASLPEAYALTLPKVSDLVYVLGPYVAENMGGCDIISKVTNIAPSDPLSLNLKVDSVESLISKYAKRGHVLFEGVVVSYMYGAIGLLMEKWGKESVFVFLDTPLEECIQRVEVRRGRPRDDRLVRNMTNKFDFGKRVLKKIEREGKMRAEVIASGKAPDLVLHLLQNAKPLGRKR